MEERDTIQATAEPIDLFGRNVLAEARALHRRSERLRKQVEVALARAKLLVATNNDPKQL